MLDKRYYRRFIYRHSTRLSQILFKKNFPVYVCLRNNISDCDILENRSYQSSYFMIYNPSTFNISTVCYVAVESDKYEYQIKTDSGKEVTLQLIDLIEGLEYLPERMSNTNSELAFKCDLPAMTLSGFILNVTKNNNDKEYRSNVKMPGKLQINLKSKTYIVEIINSNKIRIENVDEKLSTIISIEVGYYEDFSGNNRESKNQSSGAYVFRPVVYKKLSQLKFQPHGVDIMNDKSDDFVQQTSTRFVDVEQNIQVNITIRLSYNGSVEMHGLVGSLVGQSVVSRTLVVRYNTNIDQSDYFVADSNCRRNVKNRMCPSKWFTSPLNDSIAECYRPICGFMYIKAPPIEMTILTDRTQGGTVFYCEENKGAVFEFAVAKRSVNDDGLGMDEILDERYEDGTGIWTKFQHYILLTSTNTGSVHRRSMLNRINNPAVMFYSSALSTNNNRLLLSSLRAVLPDGLSLLSLIVQNNEDAILSDSIVLDLESIFDRNCVMLKNVKETSLDGQTIISEFSELSKGKSQVHFSPLSIKTFILQLQISC
ncbi:hypothetical protein GJ496_001287 [Pomphorhynchus laevis]|nr:hypothetical protein GJ496_001287 [Pomphorhynchus laevis]